MLVYLDNYKYYSNAIDLVVRGSIDGIHTGSFLTLYLEARLYTYTKSTKLQVMTSNM